MTEITYKIPNGDYCIWCHYCEYNERWLAHFCLKYKEKLSTENFGTFFEARKCWSCIYDGRNEEKCYRY